MGMDIRTQKYRELLNYRYNTTLLNCRSIECYQECFKFCLMGTQMHYLMLELKDTKYVFGQNICVFLLTIVCTQHERIQGGFHKVVI